jgi:hypothetical protein
MWVAASTTPRRQQLATSLQAPVEATTKDVEYARAGYFSHVPLRGNLVATFVSRVRACIVHEQNEAKTQKL